MTRDMRRLAVVLALAALAGASWWLSHSMRTAEEPVESGPQHEPDYIIEKFTSLSLRPDGQRRYALSAAKLTHYADDGSSELDQPYLIQYGEGAPVNTRADHGWMPRDNSHILMTGHVRVARGHDPKSAGAEVTAQSMNIVLNR